MATAYGTLETIQNNNSLKNDCQAIFDLLSTTTGMKVCRELFRQLGTVVSTGQELAAALIDAEKAMGFSKTVRIPSTQQSLAANMFLGYVAGKCVLIDQGAGGGHGTNTHRIQWWLVYAAHQQKKCHLNKLPGQLYELIGFCKTPVTLNGPKYVWDDLFDQTIGSVTFPSSKLGPNGQTTTKSTFGRPEYLASWLYEKATATKGTNSDKVYQNLGKAFSELEEMKADEICTGTLIEPT